MQKNKIAIIIPCFNEGITILNIYKKAQKYGRVLIVDDCSSDNTKNILFKKKINFLKNKKNLGYEASIIKGIKYIFKYWKNTKYIVTIDGDGELLPKYIAFLIKNLLKDNLDIIVGSRNKMNRITEIALKLIFNLKFNVNDPISGLKIYKSDSLKKIISLISTKLFLVDILVISYYYGYVIGSLKINVNNRKGKPRVGNSFLVNMKILNIIFNTFFSNKFKKI